MTIEVRDSEVAALVQMGLLDPEMRDDAGEITTALCRHLNRTLN